MMMMKFVRFLTFIQSCKIYSVIYVKSAEQKKETVLPYNNMEI